MFKTSSHIRRQKMNLSNLWFVIILVLNFSYTIIAQIPDKKDEPISCRMENALQLVEGQVIEANKKTESVKLIKILTRAAEFTWDLDELKAREYYTKAFDTAKKRFAEKGFEQDKAGNEKDVNIFLPKPDYRMDVIRSIAKKDSKWARKLTEEILKLYEKDLENRDSLTKTKELSELMRIAIENLENNRALSNFIFDQVMKYPLDNYWLYGLMSIVRTDPAYADKLYQKLLNNYRNESIRRLLFLSSYPFARDRIMGADKMQYGSQPPENFIQNIPMQIAFTQVFLNRINVLTSVPTIINQRDEENRLTEPVYMITGLLDLEPYVRDNFPQMLQSYGLTRSKVEGLLTDDNRKYLENQQRIFQQNQTTFEEKIKQLEEADSENKLTDFQIINLVFWLKKEEEFKILESWLDKIKNEKNREETVNYFYHKRSTVALENKNFELARKYADKVPEVEFRGMLYFDIVRQQFNEYNESPNVRENLLEVSKFARKSKDTVSKAQVLLGLANIYEEVEHFYALDELGEAVKVINKLENPDIFAGYISRQIFGQGFGFVATFSTPGYNLENAFNAVSKKDFELTLAHAESLNDQYFQTLAVLAIAKNCVENSKREAEEKKLTEN